MGIIERFDKRGIFDGEVRSVEALKSTKNPHAAEFRDIAIHSPLWTPTCSTNRMAAEHSTIMSRIWHQFHSQFPAYILIITPGVAIIWCWHRRVNKFNYVASSCHNVLDTFQWRWSRKSGNAWLTQLFPIDRIYHMRSLTYNLTSVEFTILIE